jgi:hypothetical protein
MNRGLISKGCDSMTPQVEGNSARSLSGRCKVQPLWILAQVMVEEASLVTEKNSI